MPDVIQVITTAGSEADAQRLARILLEARLAACVQILGPIQSGYWWQGKIEQSTEWVCVAKTLAELYSAVERAWKSAHPYQEPEILAIPVLAGSSGYLSWVSNEVRAT